MRILGVVLLILGCATVAQPPRGPDLPHVVVPALEYELHDDGELYHAVIPFRYTNRTSDTLVLTGCNPPSRPVLEWWNGTEWRFAFHHIELDCLSSPFVIPPATVIDDTLRLRVSRDSMHPDGNKVNPYWLASRTIGDYRLTWPLKSQASVIADRRYYGGDLRQLSERVSNTFRLRLRRAAAPQN